MTSEAMTTAVSNFTDIIGDVMTMVGGNPILLTVFCSGLVMVAIKAVKKLVKIGR